MNQLAVLALGSAALLLHAVLLLLAAPLLAQGGAPWRVPARWSGWRDALARPYRDLLDLAGRETVRSEGASAVPRWAPTVALAFTACAALLTPSFLLGMPVGPMADLLLLLALTATARAVWLAAAADGGAAAPGIEAVGGAVDGLLAVPGLLLSAAMLALLSGGTGLDAMLAVPRGAAAPGVLASVCGLLFGALACGGRDEGLSQALSGMDLALFRLEGGLRRLVLVDLLGALFWPASLAPAQSGPLSWLLAFLFWVVRFALALLLLRLARTRLREARSRRALATLSVFAALLGPILLLAGQNGE